MHPGTWVYAQSVFFNFPTVMESLGSWLLFCTPSTRYWNAHIQAPIGNNRQ